MEIGTGNSCTFLPASWTHRLQPPLRVIVHATSLLPMDGLYHSDGDGDVGEDILPNLEPDLKYCEDWNF